MEDGDVTALLQLFLDLKATGGGNVLQIHPAEGTGQQRHGVDDVIHVLAADAEGNGVHATEFLEEHALALHHRHPRLGADISQPQHRRAVGDHRHRVPAAGQGEALVDVLLDLQAGLGHARGIGQAQGLPAVHLCPGHYFDLALQLLMQLQGFFCVIHLYLPPFKLAR